MKVALLNRIITVQRNTAVTDEIGNHLNTWTAFYTCHATVSGETDAEAEEAGTTVDDTNTFLILYSRRFVPRWGLSPLQWGVTYLTLKS